MIPELWCTGQSSYKGLSNMESNKMMNSYEYLGSEEYCDHEFEPGSVVLIKSHSGLRGRCSLCERRITSWRGGTYFPKLWNTWINDFRPYTTAE
jgi:hypothetical protein